MSGNILNENHGYFGLKRNEDGETVAFCYMFSVASATEWLEGGETEEAEPEGGEVNESLSPSAIKLRDAMDRAVELTHGQSEMVILASMLAPAFVQRIIEEEIVSPMISGGQIIEKKENGEVYAIKDSPFSWFVPAREKLDRTRSGLSVLPQAAFMGVVASFDSGLSDIIGTMLRIKPERLHQSNKTVALADIISAGSVSDVIDKVIDDEIYTLFRGSHQEQVKYIESNFHIEISKSWKRWPDYIEIFERRNLIAHGERKFTQRYVDICKENNHKGCENLLGKEVMLSIAYMHQALDVLLEFSLLLIFSFWRKHLEKENIHLFGTMNQIVYKLIESKRYMVAVRVAEYVRGLKNPDATDAVMRMITINLASAYLHMKDESSSKRVIDSVDWSACSDDYKICVAALSKDIEKFVELMPVVAASNSVSKVSFKEWPVFDFVRGEQTVRDKFLEIFRESLIEVESAKLLETQEETDQSENGDNTVH